MKLVRLTHDHNCSEKTFQKERSDIITYRDLKLFDGIKFREETRNQLEQSEKLTGDDFKSKFVSAWNSHAPVKKRLQWVTTPNL